MFWIIFSTLAIIFAIVIIACIIYVVSSKKNKEENEAYEKAKKEDAEREEWKATHIKKAVIVATRVGKNNGSAIIRGVVGDALIGTSGAVIGTSTAKQKQFTTFLLVYEDDTRETKEVENGSPLYQTYINYIEI